MTVFTKAVSFISIFTFCSVLENGLLFAQPEKTADDTCHMCAPPGGVAKGGLMDLLFDNAPPLQNCTSIERTIIRKYDNDIQALDVHYERGGHCFDTIVEMGHVASIGYGGLGLSGNPVEVRAAPARELFRSHGTLRPPASFVTITPFIGYGGSDTTRRKIGFSSIYYGLEVLAAPFGTLLGDEFALAFAGSLLEEGGRTRIPLGGNLRWTFLGSEHVEESHRFVPGPCKFGLQGDRADTMPSGYSEVPAMGRAPDSSVFYIHEREITRSPFRAYLYAEGGWILNGSFAGAGRDPSANPNDYSQYYAGVGAGVILFDWLTASLGYRYMRLNLRTPCAVCPGDVFIQNTDVSHSVLLKIGANLPF
jgi:hypothetical protein